MSSGAVLMYVRFWCSVVCAGVMCLTCGVTIIISYTILFSSSDLSSPLSSSSHPSHSFYTCRYLHTLIYIVLFYSHLLLPYSSNPSSQSSPLLLLPNLSLLPFPHHVIHSILVGTYISLFIFYQLSGQFDPACFIGVDG